ncbi:hypothetical protein SERLADRAFT_379445 [Serpula lacrymans var. lacrymans S7.9]|uniref:Uncharacterized protein n=1 Tax=Serpula lacrymans var. lacrymans (strain S7.9) TaxID=578457 RepID=F8NH48_SERL9|nr:uncharacterized protein SERLADRAFT_379445 [Serpula lacrymans var. lacrymans S7.9]EGO29905.1 hypothetical protein SERLADRAFT_379445 [Serpula lacrymans var. lacrymans S7.9]
MTCKYVAVIPPGRWSIGMRMRISLILSGMIAAKCFALVLWVKGRTHIARPPGFIRRVPFAYEEMSVL